MLASILAYLLANKVMLATALFLLSEAIGLFPGVAASGVFQAIFNGVVWIYKAIVGKEPPTLPKEEG